MAIARNFFNGFYWQLGMMRKADKADGTAHEDFPAFVEQTAQISAAIVMKMMG